MLRGRLRVLLLLAAHLPLLCAEKSNTEKTSFVSGSGKAKPDSCGKECEDSARVRKRSPQGAKCELYYFVPTAKRIDKAFFVWNNTKAEQLEAYHKIVPFLKANPHEDKPLFFPAHLPLVKKRGDGNDALVLKDVYVRAQGSCGDVPKDLRSDAYFDTKPAWFKNQKIKQQVELRMLENYVQWIPRSHWGYRVPMDDEDVCLDDTGLVVKEFPGIRTCFSMWTYDDYEKKPKHFAGRQIYNRINQKAQLRTSRIGFDRSGGNSHAEPIRAELFSLPALFLKEMCFVTNASLENRCTYWATNEFYVSLCCCYTNRTECAYRSYKFPLQKKEDGPVILACATGNSTAMKPFGGSREPKNASGIASSVKKFVQDKTSSEVCKWTYTWDPRNETLPEDVMQVELGVEKSAAIKQRMRGCKSGACCQRATALCPLDANSTIKKTVVECFCTDGDLCNIARSYFSKELVRMFKEARPCETDTVFEHLLWRRTTEHRKKNKDWRHGYMCPVFYNFAQSERKNAFLQLVRMNNFWFVERMDIKLFQQDGCHLVEVKIVAESNCTEKLFGGRNDSALENLLILLCAVEGNPLGERRESYPDAELKKTIEANLTAAKEKFPICKTDSLSLDFESLSELVVDNRKLARLYDNITEGTNADITTAHCYAEVSFVYQHRYDFTFGAVSIDNKSLHESCHESEDSGKCVRLNSTADDEHQHFACCCRRHWNSTQDMCREVMLDQLKTLLGESVIAKTPGEIMDELKNDSLSKCDEAGKANEGQAGTYIDRPCARNDGCYTGVHARDLPANTQHKKFGGCVSEYAPGAQKRDGTTSNEVEARFYRICRLPRNKGQCFAAIGTEDVALPDDVKGPQMVCCCGGQLDSAQKCGTSQKFGMKIGDFDL